MNNIAGKPIWYELLTSNSDRAEDFYQKIFGWQAVTTAQSAVNNYRIVMMGDRPVGGILKLTAEMIARGAKPMWLAYYGVHDCDAVQKMAQDLGAEVYLSATDIPDIGRFALLADPQGAMFYIMQPLAGNESQAFAPMRPGHGGWHELHTSDMEAGFEFYQRLFGWTKVQDLDMSEGGEGGPYRLFAWQGQSIGGMVGDDKVQRSTWIYYFSAADIDAAVGKIKASGGEIVLGPIQVPGGAWIINAKDVEGVSFAVVGMRPN